MRTSRQAFTLIEMLVVIGIIAILSTGISMLNMKDSAQPMYSANRTMMAAFHEARTNAIKRQTPSRVIIYRGDDLSRKLRQVGVIYKVKGTDDEVKGWVALNRGIMLPEGVFFVPPQGDFSTMVKLQNGLSDSDVFKSTFNNGYSGVFNRVGLSEFPSATPLSVSEGNGDWYSYEFSSDGLSMNPGAYIMLVAGNLDPKGVLLVDNAFSQMGFVVRRIGNTIPFTDYGEMEETIK